MAAMTQYYCFKCSCLGGKFNEDTVNTMTSQQIWPLMVAYVFKCISFKKLNFKFNFVSFPHQKTFRNVIFGLCNGFTGCFLETNADWSLTRSMFIGKCPLFGDFLSRNGFCSYCHKWFCFLNIVGSHYQFVQYNPLCIQHNSNKCKT